MASPLAVRPHLAPSARPTSAARRWATAGAAVALALGLGACSATNPITTVLDYDASDGTLVELGDLRLSNLILLTEAEGAPATLLGAVSNRGADPASVTLSIDGEPVGGELRLGAGDTALLGPQHSETIDIDAAPTAPGTFVRLTITSPSDGTATANVPVLDGTFEQYTDLVPAAED